MKENFSIFTTSPLIFCNKVRVQVAALVYIELSGSNDSWDIFISRD